MAQRLKLVEIGVAAIAVAGFVVHAYEAPGKSPTLSLIILYVALFGFGVIGSLFGPIKYGILPDHLERRELPAGNALVEGATFIAILLGTIVGGIAAKGGGIPAAFSALVMCFALLCWVSALFIPKTGEAAPESHHQQEHRDLDLVADPASALRSEAVVGRAGDELVLAGRRRRAVAVAAGGEIAGRRQRGNRSPPISPVLGRGRDRLGLAAWLCAGRIILLPTLLGALCLGIFSLVHRLHALGTRRSRKQFLGPTEVFATSRGIKVAIGLVGLAIGGGPVHRAGLRCGAGLGRRRPARARGCGGQRAQCAVHDGRDVVRRTYCRPMASPRRCCSSGSASANFIVAVVIAFTMPTRPFNDALSIIYRALFRAEVHGLDNLQKVNSPNVILALNHVSFLDAGIAMSLLGRDPLFAIDTAMAQKWWVKPFSRMTRAMPIDPLKPMATRTLIHAVQSGETLIIFPEGRLTVTGSLMKVYDGAGLIADKSDATIVPIRIEGLERSPFTRLRKDQVRRKLFPKLTRDGARAGQAQSRSGVARQGAPARGGRRALRHHVGHDLQDHARPTGPFRRR